MSVPNTHEYTEPQQFILAQNAWDAAVAEGQLPGDLEPGAADRILAEALGGAAMVGKEPGMPEQVSPPEAADTIRGIISNAPAIGRMWVDSGVKRDALAQNQRGPAMRSYHVPGCTNLGQHNGPNTPILRQIFERNSDEVKRYLRGVAEETDATEVVTVQPHPEDRQLYLLGYETNTYNDSSGRPGAYLSIFALIPSEAAATIRNIAHTDPMALRTIAETFIGDKLTEGLGGGAWRSSRPPYEQWAQAGQDKIAIVDTFGKAPGQRGFEVIPLTGSLQ